MMIQRRWIALFLIIIACSVIALASTSSSSSSARSIRPAFIPSLISCGSLSSQSTRSYDGRRRSRGRSMMVMDETMENVVVHPPPSGYPDDRPVKFLPDHLAIILDGNGRWAERRGLPRAFGHGEGAGRALDILSSCRSIGIKTVTLYCLSTENWTRPPEEVSLILKAIESSLRANLVFAHRNQVRLVAVGQRSRLPDSLSDLITQVERETADYQGMTVCLALSYGGRDEIIHACQSLAQEVQKGQLQPQDINESIFEAHLESTNKHLCPPDLIIRTSGECRLSNFMLYQAAYSEFYVTSALWPDFTERHLKEALRDFAKRTRKYGSLKGGEGHEQGDEEEQKVAVYGTRGNYKRREEEDDDDVLSWGLTHSSLPDT